MAKSNVESVITPFFRVSYPNVFQARRNELSGKDEYSLTALFPKGADLAALKKSAQQAIIDKWGENKAKWPKNLRTPFRDQAEKEKSVDDAAAPDGVRTIMPDGHEKGAIFINMKSTKQPGIVDSKNQPIIDAEGFYAGCWARASVRAYAYEMKGNAGVAFGLNHVQKWKDDEPFSGRRKAEEEFTPIATEGDTDAESIF